MNNSASPCAHSDACYVLLDIARRVRRARLRARALNLVRLRCVAFLGKCFFLCLGSGRSTRAWEQVEELEEVEEPRGQERIGEHVSLYKYV